MKFCTLGRMIGTVSHAARKKAVMCASVVWPAPMTTTSGLARVKCYPDILWRHLCNLQPLYCKSFALKYIGKLYVVFAETLNCKP